MAKKKFYAIKKGRNVENKIVLSWSECKKIVNGYPSIFKSFSTEEDALNYLGIKKNNSNKNKKSKSKNEITTLEIKNKSKKNENFKVQISSELYTDFIEKCISKHISKDMIISYIINNWTYSDDEKDL